MAKHNVGGQAVIEGVMMRSPHSFSVAIRTPDRKILVRESPWESLWERIRFLRWPFLRGSVVLLESLWNGISALNFSAMHALPPEEGDKGKSSEPMTKAALTLTIIFAIAFGLALFVALPHFLTWLLGKAAGTEIDVKSFWFHAIDGAIKIAIFVLYLWLISMLPDIRRTFMYHGAEHKSIFAYENGAELTVGSARSFSSKHPRCGTSFILIVLLFSIFMFAVVFPFVPPLLKNQVANNILYVFIKIALIFPIGGISYEMLKLSGKYRDNIFVKAVSYPGLVMQRLTTRESTDDQLEVALVALRKTLWRESVRDSKPRTSSMELVESFDSFEDFISKYPGPYDAES